MTRKLGLEHWVKQFAESAAANTDAIMVHSNAKLANKHTDRMVAAFNKLKSAGNNGRDALMALFQHERMDVRTAAAAFLLRYRTAEAKAVLEEAAKGRGLVPFEAQECLKRWEEGTWELDPDPVN